jgi:serine/threonine protein kinase/formylglycine-generating enzyme required for sulfatase activity
MVDKIPSDDFDAQRVAKSMDLTEGKKISHTLLGERFQIIRRLGEGGFGQVVLALDRVLGRQVALKFPRQNDSSVVRGRFVKEAQTVARLRHPNIIPVFDCIQSEQQVCLVTEYITGKTLREWLDQGEIARPMYLKWIIELADALEYAAAEGIVHRDVKPENIMIDDRGRAQLMDFGLAEFLSDENAQTGKKISGTPTYMSPEQANGNTQIGPKSDQYSLASVLYELSTRCRPVTASGRAILIEIAERETPPLHPLREVDFDLQNIILKAMSRDPSQRYSSCNDFALDLRRFQYGHSVVASSGHYWHSFVLWLKRERKSAIAVVSAITCLLAFSTVATVSYLWVSSSNQALGKALTSARNAEKESLAAKKDAERDRDALLVAQKAMEKTLAEMDAAMKQAQEQRAIAESLAVNLRAQETAISEQQEALIESYIAKVENSRTEELAKVVEDSMQLPKETLLPRLKRKYGALTLQDRNKLAYALAMAALGDVDLEYFVDFIPEATSQELQILIPTLRKSRGSTLSIVSKRVGVLGTTIADLHRKIEWARLALILGDTSIAADMAAFRDRPDTTERSLLIAGLMKKIVDPNSILLVIDGESDVALLSALVSSLGFCDPNLLESADRLKWTEVVRRLASSAENASVSAAARWVLYQWNDTGLNANESSVAIAGSNWVINGSGVMMIECPEGQMNSQQASLIFSVPFGSQDYKNLKVSSFWLSSSEITYGQFREFLEDPAFPQSLKAKFSTRDHQEFLNEKFANVPAREISSVAFALYCNWLSRRDKKSEYYALERAGGNGKFVVKENPDSDGYRLPTQFEWEYACRAGSDSNWWSGGEAQLINSFHDVGRSREFEPMHINARPPNAWGFFNMDGGLSEWCRSVVNGDDEMGGDRETAFPIIALDRNFMDRVKIEDRRSGSKSEFYSGFRVALTK